MFDLVNAHHVVFCIKNDAVVTGSYPFKHCKFAFAYFSSL